MSVREANITNACILMSIYYHRHRIFVYEPTWVMSPTIVLINKISEKADGNSNTCQRHLLCSAVRKFSQFDGKYDVRNTIVNKNAPMPHNKNMLTNYVSLSLGNIDHHHTMLWRYEAVWNTRLSIFDSI